jgi:hypothetical protein
MAVNGSGWLVAARIAVFTKSFKVTHLYSETAGWRFGGMAFANIKASCAENE